MLVLVVVGPERCKMLIERLVGVFEYKRLDRGPGLDAYRVLCRLLEKLLLKVLGVLKLFDGGGE